jgi:hypothetical protein
MSVHATHEPRPWFHEVMQEVQTNPLRAKSFWVDKKFPVIQSTVDPIYVETSHLICKGFLEPLLEMNIAFDVISLRRNPRDVAMSMVKLNTIPGRTKYGMMYYLSPFSENNFTRLNDVDKFTDYQLCYWYCLEIDQRRKVYEEKVKKSGNRSVFITFDELIAGDGVLKVKEVLQLPRLSVKGFLKRIIQPQLKKVNAKTNRKNNLQIQDDLDELEWEVRDEIRICDP